VQSHTDISLLQHCHPVQAMYLFRDDMSHMYHLADSLQLMVHERLAEMYVEVRIILILKKDETLYDAWPAWVDRPGIDELILGGVN